MAGRKNFVAGEILTSADVNSFLMDQSVMVFDDSAARGSAIPSPTEGMVTYRKDTNLVEAFDGSAYKPLGGVVQVKKVTDTTNRITTSTSPVDADIELSFTPKFADSLLIVEWTFTGDARRAAATITSRFGFYRLVEVGGSVLEGAEQVQIGRTLVSASAAAAPITSTLTARGFVVAGSTSARTYRGEFWALTNNQNILINSNLTGVLTVTEIIGGVL